MNPKFPDLPRSGRPSASPGMVAYLQRRQRNRRKGEDVVAVDPDQVSGLVLWLDAALGARKAWDDAPATAAGTVTTGSGNWADSGQVVRIRIYPYRLVGGVPEFSWGCTEAEATAPNSLGICYFDWSWSAVDGADGYRVLRAEQLMGSFDFNVYQDVATNALVDDDVADWAAGSTVTPWSTTAAAAGDPVAAWNDQSGGGSYLWHTALACRPVLASVGSLSAMRFSNAGDGMASALTVAAPLTVFAVYASHVATSGACRVVQGAQVNWLLGPYSAKYQLYDGNGMVAGLAVVADRVVVHCGRVSSGGSAQFVDGVAAGTGAGVDGPGIFCLSGFGAYPEGFDGDMFEVVVYDRALTDVEVAGVSLGLKNKYGI